MGIAWPDARDLVNESDPIGLIGTGAPTDEYDCLMGPLLRRLQAEHSIEEIAAFLDREMIEHFGVPDVAGHLPFAAKAQAWYINRWPE